jgi:hypothetical protein
MGGWVMGGWVMAEHVRHTTINKPLFSTSSTKYKKFKFFDSSTMHQKIH